MADLIKPSELFVNTRNTDQTLRYLIQPQNSHQTLSNHPDLLLNLMNS